jgi:hypothetical protein
MSDIKIFTPNNNIQLDDSLIFPKDIEEIDSRVPSDNKEINVQKVAENNFSFPDADYEKNNNNLKDKTQDVEKPILNKSQIQPKKPDTFFDNILNKIDKIITLENVIFGLIVIGCFALRNIFVPFLSGDVTTFLDPWMKYIEQNGSFLAFKEKFFDYSPAYVYILWVGTLLNFNLFSSIW